MPSLEAKFLETLSQIGVSQDEARKMFINLTRHYRDKSRGHHSLKHVEECIDWVRGDLKKEISRPVMMELAFYWHDAVYVATRHSNETESAALAIVDLSKTEIQIFEMAEVMTFILTYEGGLKPTTNDAKYFRDIDYWIIGSPRERYLSYMKGIEKEYLPFYSPEEYCSGRLKFLGTLRNQDRLFLTDYFEDNFRQAAIENIDFEISSLNAR